MVAGLGIVLPVVRRAGQEDVEPGNVDLCLRARRRRRINKRNSTKVSSPAPHHLCGRVPARLQQQDLPVVLLGQAPGQSGARGAGAHWFREGRTATLNIFSPILKVNAKKYVLCINSEGFDSGPNFFFLC